MSSLEDRMNQVLARLGLNYKVKWVPDENAENHAIIKNQTIIINDTTEEEAWNSLIHEILELKLRPLLSYYRELVNTLISFIEKRAYIEKEKLLESLPSNFMLIMTQEKYVMHTKENDDKESKSFK